MVLALNVLNSDLTLNNFQNIGSFSAAKGTDGKLICQIFQADKKIRYIPISSAVITVTFAKADGTTLVKTASFPFADDRSIFEVDFTAAESLNLISQNLIAQIVEGSVTSIAILQNGFQMIPLTQGC